MPTFTLQQLLLADSGDPSPSKAPENYSAFPSVEVALTEGKCKDEIEIVFDAIKAAPFCVTASDFPHQGPGTKMQNGLNSDNGKLTKAESNGVHPNCVNASNPYHKCAEYCHERMRDTDSLRGRMSVYSLPMRKGKLNMVERKDVDPSCVNASNPYHKCEDYCLKKQETRMQQERMSVSSPKSKGKLKMMDRKDVDPNCVNASNPYHKCAEYCIGRKQEMNNQQGRKSDSSLLKSKGNLGVVERKDVDPNCVNASNPYHKCAEYCLKRKQEMDSQPRRKSDSSLVKNQENFGAVERKDVDPNCVNASNPYHKCAEYCLKRKQEMDSQPRRKSDSSLLKSKGYMGMAERKDVNPNCANASNPYHKCADYCLERNQEMNSQQGKKSGSSHKSKENLALIERKDVDPRCVNASNPYHKCAEYCLEKKQEIGSQLGRKSVSSSPKSNGKLAILETKNVNPNCVNASNPYLKCAEYCHERKHETNSLQGTKSVSSLSKGKGKLILLGTNEVDPNCVNASNPYHKCAEYCSDRVNTAR